MNKIDLILISNTTILICGPFGTQVRECGFTAKRSKTLFSKNPLRNARNLLSNKTTINSTTMGFTAKLPSYIKTRLPREVEEVLNKFEEDFDFELMISEIRSTFEEVNELQHDTLDVVGQNNFQVKTFMSVQTFLR